MTCSLLFVTDCPSLLCEELEDLETKDNEGNMRSRRRVGEEEVFSQREDEEAGEETEREEKEGEEEKKEEKVVSEKELMVTEGEEEEQVKPESRMDAEEALEVQTENNEIESTKETVADTQETKVSIEQKDEQKKSRKRRGKKQSEQVRNRRGAKDVVERFEEKKKAQEGPVMSSEESSALSEPSVGLMNSCDLSDSVYLGFGGTGLYCPPVPIPLLYSSQPPVPIQPAPPQPRGTKRPHSPLLPHSLPQQGTQPLEVRLHT